ncbi:diguanylate cyclase (GGDEF)-like protein [Methylohalomonas lacus]|uniref:diguanylate cyclase n=1 Tax=Methylohalomonas lacus TaxID=398773 RepID=A0AAE3HK70_9GAMM|nr:sensor domain-containing diguanylate cyclase [Methylohalomonas lacus]MCS3902594.1 diguanylate cyclase (GGDEF)-like protein [Methylohalomonas lacus]
MNNPLTEKDDPRVALYEGCEAEPIHIPGSIQPRGALLAVDRHSGEILQVSLNTERYLGYQPEGLLGKDISFLIGAGPKKQIMDRDLAPVYPNLNEPVLVTIAGEDNHSHELIMMPHLNDGVVILEFEFYNEQEAAPLAAYHRLLATLNRISQSRSEDELLQQAVTEVQALTGYERVMYYRFKEDGSGIVTHEARTDSSIGSYLDHHFPAADIPARARELYRQNSLRFIFDPEARAVPIRPANNPRTGKPLDLTYAVFRSIAPVHIEYLRNMGVGASLSLSIVIDDHLEGLIACHHRSSSAVSQYLRVTCQSVAVAVTSHLSKLRASSTSSWNNEIRESLEPFINEIINGQRLVTAFRHHIDTLMSLMDADSAFLQFGKEQVAAPKAAEKQPFPVQLRGVCTGPPVYASDRLGELRSLPGELREYLTGGIVIDLDNGDFLCLGRREYLDDIVWGGDPTKPMVNGDTENPRLSPRSSFASWRETVRGRSRAFGAREKTMATALRHIMFEAKALEFRRLAEEKMQLEARTDSLTDLINRKEFYRRGQEEIERARRYGRELALVYFDIDHFKVVNDTHGHDAGDRVLRRVADLCRERLRVNDICARLGGEEFVILLPETQLQAAVHLAECLREQFENDSVSYDDIEIRVTSSFGVAVLGADPDETLETVLKRADTALYQAKAAGRNRVVSDL